MLRLSFRSILTLLLVIVATSPSSLLFLLCSILILIAPIYVRVHHILSCSAQGLSLLHNFCLRFQSIPALPQRKVVQELLFLSREHCFHRFAFSTLTDLFNSGFTFAHHFRLWFCLSSFICLLVLSKLRFSGRLLRTCAPNPRRALSAT